MPRLGTLPSSRDQARHALTLLGVPAAPRLVVDVHAAFLAGDLSVAELTRLRRADEARHAAEAGDATPPAKRGPVAERGPVAGHGHAGEPGDPTAKRPVLLCAALDAADLTPARGLIALSSWPVADRVVTELSARVAALTAAVRVAEFAAGRVGASGAVDRLLRRLATTVPGGTEAYQVFDARSLADAARAALADPRLAAQQSADRDVRAGAVRAAAALDEGRRLFGVRDPVRPVHPGRPG